MTEPHAQQADEVGRDALLVLLYLTEQLSGCAFDLDWGVFQRGVRT